MPRTPQLTARDTDTQRDYCDACVDGGFPRTEPPPPCEGDACHGPTPPLPVFGPLGSLTFTGPGNLVSTSKLVSSGKPKPKVVSRAERLVKALKSCRKRHQHSKHSRAICERQARKRYTKRKTHGKVKK